MPALGLLGGAKKTPRPCRGGVPLTAVIDSGRPQPPSESCRGVKGRGLLRYLVVTAPYTRDAEPLATAGALCSRSCGVAS
jgi:hypothetical protein